MVENTSIVDADKALDFLPAGKRFEARHVIIDGVLQEGETMIQVGTTGKSLIYDKVVEVVQTSGPAVDFLGHDLEAELGVTSEDLRTVLIEMDIAGYDASSDMVETDDVQLSIEGDGADDLDIVFANSGNTADVKKFKSLLSPIHHTVRADSKAWGALETHIYWVHLTAWRVRAGKGIVLV